MIAFTLLTLLASLDPKEEILQEKTHSEDFVEESFPSLSNEEQTELVLSEEVKKFLNEEADSSEAVLDRE